MIVRKLSPLLVLSVLSTCLFVLFFSHTVSAIEFNNLHLIPEYKQSHLFDYNVAAQNMENYRCKNANESPGNINAGVYGGAYHSWISPHGNSAGNIPELTPGQTITLDINWMGNHCTSNMNTPTASPPSAASRLIINGSSSSALRRTKGNISGITATLINTGTWESYPGTVSYEPGDIGEINWHSTYGDGNPAAEKYYTEIAKKQFSLTVPETVPPGNYIVRIWYANRAVSRSGLVDSPSASHGCVNPNGEGVRPAASGLTDPNCPTGSAETPFFATVGPRPVSCSITVTSSLGVVTPGSQFSVNVTINNSTGYLYSTAGNHRFLAGITTDTTPGWNGVSGFPPSAISPPDRTNQWRNLGAGTNSWLNTEVFQGFTYQRVAVGGSSFSFTAYARDTNGNNLAFGNHNMTIRFLSRDGFDWIPHHSSCSTTVRVEHRDDGTCTISAPSEAIINQSFSVTVTARNTGTTTWTSGGNYRLGATSGVSPNWGVSRTNLPTAPPFNNGVPPNWDVPFTFNITAPSTPGTYTFSRRMIKGEAGWFGTPCQVNIIIKYATPTAHCRVDDRVEQVIGTPVRRTLYVWYSGANTYPAGSGSQAVATTDLREGTTLMSNFTGRGSQSGRNGTSDADSFVFTYDHTYNNPGVIQTNGRATIRTPDGVGGTRTSTTASCSDGTNVGYQPFMKVYGGAVRAGGTFCNETTARADGRYGGVYGFGRSLAPYKGMSSQLTIEALLAVKGAYSASLRGSTPAPLKGLTLANDDAAQSNGGEFAGSHPDCITDYFEQTRDESIQADLSVNPFPPEDIPAQPQAPIRQDMFIWYNSSVSNPANADFPYCVQWNASTNPGADNRTWNDNWLCSKADLGMVWLSNTPVRPDGGWGTPTGPGSAYRVSIYNSDAYYSGVTRTPATGGGWAGRFYIGFTTRPAEWTRYDFFTHDSGRVFTPTSLGFVESDTDPTNDDRHCVNLRETQDASGWNDKWWCGPWHYLAQPPLPAVPGVFPSGPHQYVLPAGNVTLDGLSIPRGSQITVYVDGDAYITNNIVYSSDSRSALTDIPRLELYVKGNIYVAPNVTRLDGLYVAQPRNDSTKGIMYTCAGAFTTFTSAQLYTNCGNTPLAINGAVVAKQVRFLRVRSTVEQDVTGWGPGNYADGLGTNAGEVINYTPEMYLAPSASRMPADAGSGITGWQSMQALPPIW